VTVADIASAVHNPKADIQLAILSTTLDYPDPASFLAQMLGKDVPAWWLSLRVRADVARLARVTGAARDRAAISVAARLEKQEMPVVPIATQELGTVVGPRLGCRIWNGVDPALDLAALCLHHS
jgi:hypothetical protein